MIYDVAVIGAGPAGLMAAKTAADKGLKVVVIEKKRDVASVTRACCEQLIMDEDFQGETIRLSQGKILFEKNGFSVDYSGPVVNVPDKYFISPGGHVIHFAYEDRRPIVIRIDKGLLLQALWLACEKAGVAFYQSSLASHAEDCGDTILLRLAGTESHAAIAARRLIIADGANSRVAERLGLNKERTCFATALCVLYNLKGVKGFDHYALKTFFGRAYCAPAPLPMGPALEDETAYLVVIGNRARPPEKLFKDIAGSGALSASLKNAEVIKKIGCAVRAYTSMKIPHRGKVLVIGDAAAYVEVEMQGAMTCGFRAGQAVSRELSGGPGFEEYTRWWQASFEFNSDQYLQVAQGFALVPKYTDEELDYLFALIEHEVLEGTYNQYKTPRLMWGAILKHRERIACERPDLYAKITGNKATLGDML